MRTKSQKALQLYGGWLTIHKMMVIHVKVEAFDADLVDQSVQMRMWVSWVDWRTKVPLHQCGWIPQAPLWAGSEAILWFTGVSDVSIKAVKSQFPYFNPLRSEKYSRL